ncbi:DUF3347 domain-containing protein [Desertivirga arenae]|uniref:DUF3347 domain-containing protein n=1 Tax=Desertivirga arenae TaxID=2810309 RepID=UPI001A966453|nr:DUF3347 domain-containing protein [Pedobacter sp. SYSU D00823]
MRFLTILFLLSVIVGFKARAQSKKQAAYNDSFTNGYLAIKDKLVLNDSVSTKKLSIEFYEKLKGYSPKNVPADSVEIFNKLKDKLVSYAGKMASTQNVNRQRESFSPMSQLFWRMSGIIKMSTESLYYQQCPMTGVTWVSRENTIKNPYYPKNMLTCGKVVGERKGI